MSGENINGGDGQSQQKGAEDRKIFVGGISADVSNEDLQSHFTQFGEVVQAQVKIDRATGRSRGFAFVEFGSAEACTKALQEREQQIKGKTCEIKQAKSRENKKVFVGGLPADHSEEELRKYFEQFGVVEDVEWPFDKQTKARRNFAFIVFEDEKAVEEAVANPKHTFSDRECDVKKAVPQSRRGFNSNFRGPMNGPRGYGMPRQMPMHNAPWYNGGWNQMGTSMYGYQPGQNSSAGGWGDWNSTGYFPQGGQQGNTFGGNAGGYGSYSQDYSQNSGRGQTGQNGSAPQRQGYQAQY